MLELWYYSTQKYVLLELSAKSRQADSVNGPAVAASQQKLVTQLLRSEVVVGLCVSSRRLLGCCSEVAYVSDNKNRIPEARLGGVFVRNIYKKMLSCVAVVVIAFHCIVASFILAR